MEKRYTEARLQLQKGLSSEPLAAAESGLKDSEGYPDLNWKFGILTAEARIRNDAYTRALEVLEPEPPVGASREIFWRRTLMQAYALCFLNNYVQAEEHFKQAEAIDTGSDGSKAELAYIRGRCEMNRGDRKKAEAYFGEALKPNVPVDPFVKTYVLLSLGWCANQDLQSEEAIDWYSQAVATVRPLQAPLLEEQALGNLGSTYEDLGDFPDAEKNVVEAEKITSQWKILSDEQRWLTDIGVIQRHHGQLGAAEESYTQALAIAMKLHNTDIAAKCLHNLIALNLYEGHLAQAEDNYRAGAALDLHGDALRLRQLDEAAIATAHADYGQAISKLQVLLQQVENEGPSGEKPPYRIKWLIQAALARNYAAEGNTSEAEQWFKRSIVTVEEAANRMKHEEFATTMRDNIPVYDEYVAFLITQQRPEQALQIAQLGRARTLMQGAKGPHGQENPKVWLARVQSYLHRNNSILLSYFATEKECYLWAITANQLRAIPLGISGPDLDNLIDTYKQEIIQQHSTLSESRAGKKLFQVLVKPASDLMPKGSHVIIVADSKIYSVSFETLIASEGADHYWIEDVGIENTNSIDLLIAGRPRRSPTKGLLLIGDPAQADSHYVPLPHAHEEMESVRKHFLPAEVTSFSGHDATPASYLNSFPGKYKFIYLATHGTPNAIEPLKSAIILYTANGGTYKLLASDIVNDKVHLNADLVTISACEGVGTQVQSLEGLIGLEWAFMRAGAHQVVAAFWNVDDTITPGLMDDFYGELEKGKTAAEALRHAKLAMLHAGGIHATPYYWAALELYTRS